MSVTVKVKKMKAKKPARKQTTMRVYPSTVQLVRKVAGFCDGESYADVLDRLVQREGSRVLKEKVSQISKN